MTLAGLPHSEISGSMRACRSPKHIAACHVLLRLSVPRHPPSTLSNLTIKCLDLMRSAVPISFSDTVLAFFTYPYSIVKDSRDREDRRCLQRETSLQTPRMLAMTCGAEDGGADRDRTDDPLLAKQVLSQLSYSPRPRALARELRIKELRIENGFRRSFSILNSQFSIS